MNKAQILLDQTYISLSNNYIPKADQNWSMASPDASFRYEVTGKEVTIGMLETDSLWIIPAASRHMFFNHRGLHPNFYKLKNLETRITKNNGEPGNWQSVNKMPSFPDPLVFNVKHQNEFKKAYWVCREDIEPGDSLLVELRGRNNIPFIKLHVKRIGVEHRPMLFGPVNDTATYPDDAAFVQYQMGRIYPQVKEEYNPRILDYPPATGVGNYQYSPKSRLAFYLYEPPNKTSLTYQYRLIRNGDKDTSWKYTWGVILVPELKPGASYRFEARYIDDPKLVTTHLFTVTAYWYQTLWFKIAVGAVLVILCLLLFLIWAYRRNKRLEEKRRLKMQSLFAQLNPHFVFNALGSIQGLMNNQQLDKANQYLSGFALLLRNSMLSTTKETIPLQTELKNLDNYIQLEILRFNFKYELYVDPSIPLDLVEVPPLLAQPLIENAVKHGVSAKGEAGQIKLRVVKEKQDILFSISDNGAGFDPSKVVDRHGIKLTKDRIELFNKHRRITLDIQSSANGTTVLLRFKNWLEHD
jgi:hypothetical protein